MGVAALSLLLLAGSAFAERTKPYIPSQVPVNVKPASLNESLLGVGTNRLTVVTGWEDNFFSQVSEEVGETRATATNFVLGFIRGRRERYSEEWDLIAGRLELEEETQRYTSSVIGKAVDLDVSGTGFDVGVRYLGGYTLAKTELPWGRVAEWNLAFSLHAAYYTLESTYKADSADKLDSNHYQAKEFGVFLRPAAALQPILPIGRGVSFVPFVGTNAMMVLSGEEFQDTRFVRNGFSGGLTEDSEFNVGGRGFELVFGFDLGLASPISREHQCTVGGALSKLFGGRSGDFSEVHVLYAVPIGR